MGVISKMKEKQLRIQQERESERQKERERLSSLTERELMIEMILKLNEVGDKCDDIRRKVIIYSSD